MVVDGRRKERRKEGRKAGRKEGTDGLMDGWMDGWMHSLVISYLDRPSIFLSQIHLLYSNLNPGLQGIAVTLKENLFFSAE